MEPISRPVTAETANTYDIPELSITADFFPGLPGEETVFVRREKEFDSVYVRVPVIEKNVFKYHAEIPLETLWSDRVLSIGVGDIDDDDRLDITYTAASTDYGKTLKYSAGLYAQNFRFDVAENLNLSSKQLYYKAEELAYCNEVEYWMAFPEEFPACISEDVAVPPTNVPNTSASNLEWRIQRLEFDFRRMESDVRQQDWDIDDLKRRVSSLESSAKSPSSSETIQPDGNCDSEIDEMQSRLDELESRLDDLESRIDDLEN